MNFTSGIHPPYKVKEPKLFFLFRNGRLLVCNAKNSIVLPREADISPLNIEPESLNYLGTLDVTHCYAGTIDDAAEIPDSMSFHELRGLYGLVHDEIFSVAGRALYVADWDTAYRFCGRCGHQLKKNETERSKTCPSCGQSYYPKLAPAVIVAVLKDDEILLAHNRRFRDGLYSLIAGFVEPGENLEECIRREVREETGIEVKNITYFRSQPWPYTGSLMIAFYAEHDGGSIKTDGVEISDARWFRADELPEIPGKISIARSLIDRFLERKRES